MFWDIGTRSPGRVVADIVAARTDRKQLAAGLGRFAAGAVFLLICALVVYLAVPSGEFRWYTLVQTGILVAGLLVELLVGDDVRQMLGLHRGAGTGR